ncbi:PucR family transcriptional regulator [Alicyclobacillus herbarius]|uniref:PucR family transcriptional regulator n=1 Tax=Alicyclobacillus herbarius TaxID=122960 RepID=UPI0003F754E1|nr:PucR family transcriptional regulator [Alicyclobacillus herbarius]
MPNCVRVSDALKRPPLRSSRLVAGSGGLWRPVRWVHILDVPNAREHIRGGELVLTTGLGFGQRLEQFQSFLQQLMDGQAAALCIELGTTIHELPVQIRQMADQANFPILVFPERVRFVDITEDLHKQILICEREAQYEEDWVEAVIAGRATRITGDGLPRTPNTCCRVAVLAFQCVESLEAASLNAVQQVRSPSGHSQPDSRVDRLTESRQGLLRHLIQSAFCSQGFGVRLTTRRESVVCLLERSSKEREWTHALDAAFAELHAALSRQFEPLTATTLRMGVGRVATTLVEIPSSHEDAQRALFICQRVPSPRWRMYDEAGVFRWLSLLADSPDAAAVAASDLNKVTDYDRQHGSELLHTLRVYLDCDRSKQRTAAALYIHRQTLYHRLEQLASILQSNLDDPVQRLSLHLSLYYQAFCMSDPNSI